ncbi:MAG TPA: flagellar basal body rod protein FlgC [Candidatus Binatia bacterium]|jgi:flagellar basal-body rod protein FlgC
MDLYKILTVSSAGMHAQRDRMSVVSGNLVNSETTRTPEGGPYKRRDVIFEAVPLEDDFSTLMTVGLTQRPSGVLAVEIAGVRESTKAPKRVYDPNHPDADNQGYVAYPDINVMEEMADLMSAVRSYEANLAVFNATKGLVRRLLELGRQP